MKKSTILTFATAAAIVATSAGTFATWDTLEASQSVTLTYANPVQVTMAQITNSEVLGDTINGKESVEIPVKVTVADYTKQENDKIVLTASGENNAELKGVTVSFKKSNAPLANGEDSEFVVGDNDYTAVVSVTKGDAKPDAADLTSKLEITSKLTPASSVVN